ncbi:MAG: TolC family protein [Planctomycetota bacterium]
MTVNRDTQRQNGATTSTTLTFAMLAGVTLAVISGCLTTSDPTSIELLDKKWYAEDSESERFAAESALPVTTASASPDLSSTTAWSLTDCIRVARQMNTGLTLSRDSIDIKALDVNLARGKRLPQASIGVNYMGYLYEDAETQYVTIPPSTQIPVFTFDSRPALTANAGARWDPDLNGSIGWEIVAAQAALAAADETHRDTLRQIDLAVAAQYLSVIRTDLEIATIQKSIEELEGQLSVVERLLEQDQVTANERLLVQVAVSGRRLQLDASRSSRAKALMALNQLMGLPISRQTRLVGLDLDDTRSIDLPDAETALAVAYSDSPALNALTHQLESLAAGIESVWRSSLPSFSYQVGWAYNPASSADANPHNVITHQLGLSMPLFTGGQISGNLRKMRRQASMLKTQIQSERDRIELDVLQSLEDAGVARRAIDVSTEALAQATEALRIQKQLTANDRGTRQDVLSSEQDMFAQEMNLRTAKLNYLLAVKNIERLIGKPLSAIAGMKVPSRPLPDIDRLTDDLRFDYER